MTPLVQNATNILSIVIVVSDVLAAFLFILLVTPLGRSARGKMVLDFFGANAIAFSLIVALGSVAGSLFYSEIAKFTPCLLCWWQRVFLYPQAVLLLIALIANDDRVKKYCSTLSIMGALVAIYHTYLQFGGTEIVPCTVNGVGCDKVYFLTFGYVTIPTMALTAFALILLFCLIPHRNASSEAAR